MDQPFAQLLHAPPQDRDESQKYVKNAVVFSNGDLMLKLILLALPVAGAALYAIYDLVKRPRRAEYTEPKVEPTMHKY